MNQQRWSRGTMKQRRRAACKAEQRHGVEKRSTNQRRDAAEQSGSARWVEGEHLDEGGRCSQRKWGVEADYGGASIDFAVVTERASRVALGRFIDSSHCIPFKCLRSLTATVPNVATTALHHHPY
ncbi:hypothetical protein VNO80_19238 [Phaseolus coccineus]|uniref:Uncharacterized protein n=1 Tax=Phaseolus coccineus TaxID=3886 RepID=A0AAN9MGY1_PHACN